MNLFSKLPFRIILIIFLEVLLISLTSHGLSLQAFYTAACQREIGVILNVDERRVQILNIQGEVKNIPRFEVIYLVSYPFNVFPYQGVIQNQDLYEYKIFSREKNEIKVIAIGWPIGFTKEKISFLTNAGVEFALDRRNIWGIERNISPKWNLKGSFVNVKNLFFQHPPVFAGCSNDPATQGKTISQIIPQQMLSDALTIKREFDHYQAGFQSINHYYREQDFYPVPEVYGNKTQLGVWQDINHRYGTSNHRSSLITPVFIDELSDDVFGFQRIFITGSAPISRGIHDEVQTQTYYAFKGSYFHFSALFDPNIVLVGRNYRWQLDDLKITENRLNDLSWVELGFDFGNYSISFFPGHVVSSGVARGQDFHSATIVIPGIGLSYQNYLYKVEILTGNGAFVETAEALEHNFQLSTLRLNVSGDWLSNWSPMLSYIQRQFEYTGLFTLKSQSQTFALYLQRKITSRITGGGYASLEQYAVESSKLNASESQSYTFPKLGLSVFLSF